MPATDHARRTADQPWRRWYWTARWRRRARTQLEAEPLCSRCLKGGLVTPATIAHHVVQHQGDERLFWEGELESVCKPCHDSEAQRDEKRGFVVGADVAGRPLDPAHPWNRPMGGGGRKSGA